MSRRLILAATRTFDRNALRIILRDGPAVWQIVEVADLTTLEAEIGRLGLGAAVVSGDLIAAAAPSLSAALDRLGSRLFPLGSKEGVGDWGEIARVLPGFLEKAWAAPPLVLQTGNARQSPSRGVASVDEADRPSTSEGRDIRPKGPIEAVLVAGSTGGPTALIELLRAAPHGPVPWLIVQHMPEVATASFAAHLSEATGCAAGEIGPGEALRPGRVHVLPGGSDFRLMRTHEGALVIGRARQDANPFHPNADVLFASAALIEASFVVIVLSGMGRDGAEGAARLEAAGATIFVQTPESCVVAGMPGAALEACRQARSFEPARPPDLLLRLLARDRANSYRQ